MTKKQRNRLHSLLEGVTHRNQVRARTRGWIRKRHLIMRAIRKGKIRDLASALSMAQSLELRPEVSDGPFKTKTLSVASIILVFGPDGSLIGKERT